jgi:hypothetical protein
LSHYRLLMKIDGESRCEFYARECAEAAWGVRRLERMGTRQVGPSPCIDQGILQGAERKIRHGDRRRVGASTSSTR